MDGLDHGVLIIGFLIGFLLAIAMFHPHQSVKRIERFPSVNKVVDDFETINLGSYGSDLSGCDIFRLSVTARFNAPHPLVGMWGFALKETTKKDMYALEASSYFDGSDEIRPAAFYEVNGSARRYVYANRTVKLGEVHTYTLEFQVDEHPRLYVDDELVMTDNYVVGVPRSGNKDDFRYCSSASGHGRGWDVTCYNLRIDCLRGDYL